MFRVLVVDDEPDLCDAVADVLDRYQVDAAHSFQKARERLADVEYDVVILDIMGVRGQELLELHGQRCPCIMLTAHALTPESFRCSVTGHARLFLPKDELPNLEEYVQRVLETSEPLWPWLVSRVDFSRWFGAQFDADAVLAMTDQDPPVRPVDESD